jgi:diaminobutyrate-2-oxoglutarate transaminase
MSMQISKASHVGEQGLSERHASSKGLYSFSDGELLSRQRERESNARSYPRRFPIALKRAKGIYVEDTEGHVFIDCLAAAGTLVLGHNHGVVVEAIERALRSELPMQTLDLMTPTKDEFVSELFGLLPEKWASQAKVQFCGPTGSDGVEAALKLVKTATGRGTVLAFSGAYHGMTQGSLSLMGNLGPKRVLGGQLTGVQILPYPYDYRCPFGLGGEAGERAGLEYIRSMLTDPEGGVPAPAAVILEAVQGEGGVIPASNRWLRGLRELCTMQKIPLIIDEVQTGFGRTGRVFAFEHAGITPDVLVLSKAVGGGLPLSVVVYDRALDTWQPGSHAGTFRGNQLAMAAGTATLRFLQSERLWETAGALGDALMEQLQQLQKRHACIGDVRGRGLMVGLELVDPTGLPDTLGRPPQHRELGAAVQSACLARGLIVEMGGRHGSTLRLLPPLIITAAEIGRVVGILDESIGAAYAHLFTRAGH